MMLGLESDFSGPIERLGQLCYGYTRLLFRLFVVLHREFRLHCNISRYSVTLFGQWFIKFREPVLVGIRELLTCSITKLISHFYVSDSSPGIFTSSRISGDNAAACVVIATRWFSPTCES